MKGTDGDNKILNQKQKRRRHSSRSRNGITKQNHSVILYVQNLLRWIVQEDPTVILAHRDGFCVAQDCGVPDQILATHNKPFLLFFSSTMQYPHTLAEIGRVSSMVAVE